MNKYDDSIYYELNNPHVEVNGMQAVITYDLQYENKSDNKVISISQKKNWNLQKGKWLQI